MTPVTQWYQKTSIFRSYPTSCLCATDRRQSGVRYEQLRHFFEFLDEVFTIEFSIIFLY